MSLLSFAIETARRAGALLLEGLARRRTMELKSAYEVVTEVDRASEDLIVNAIHDAFPDHAILAEEGSGIDRTSPFLWLIDPLDGTNNYAHGFPFFSVSIALMESNDLILGVVFDPLRDELFYAERGAGSWCNGRRLRVSDTQALAASLVSTGFPYDFATTTDNNAQQFVRIQARTQGVRRAGSAALDLAYVAMGRLDAHWELRLKPWDTAAGALLVLEAGGRLSDWRGAPWDPWNDRLVASNGRIHDELIAALAE
ncbi:MAG: inositol monophosphatase family protein [Roseiflexaceae bacterium]|nr:inositol monophosphatase family protein [Roseiflexaceae bacterium]